MREWRSDPATVRPRGTPPVEPPGRRVLPWIVWQLKSSAHAFWPYVDTSALFYVLAGVAVLEPNDRDALGGRLAAHHREWVLLLERSRRGSPALR